MEFVEAMDRYNTGKGFLYALVGIVVGGGRPIQHRYALSGLRAVKIIKLKAVALFYGLTVAAGVIPMASFRNQVVVGIFGAFLVMLALGLGIVFLTGDWLPAADPNQARGVPGALGRDTEPAEPEHAEPEPARKQPPPLQPAQVERVDCLNKGAPKWCRAIKYATDGERKGTTVAILRSDDGSEDREAYFCIAGDYVGPVGTYGTPKVQSELRAVTITLEPRDANPVERYIYFLAPKDMDTSSWKWLGPCPFEK